MTKEKMDLVNLINEICDKTIEKDDGWFYHGFEYDKDVFIKLLTEGIKCKKSLLMPPIGYNGNYYISLSKNINELDGYYNYSLENLPTLIIDKHIIAFKTKEVNSFRTQFINSLLPIRCSYEPDEWQAFYKINPSKIIGLHYNISTYMSLDKLIKLKEIIEVLKYLDKDLPVYDLNTNSIINKDKVLKLIK